MCISFFSLIYIVTKYHSSLSQVRELEANEERNGMQFFDVRFGRTGVEADTLELTFPGTNSSSVLVMELSVHVCFEPCEYFRYRYDTIKKRMK